jgi:crotonobetainyl-CoA:carnitine CoA-transferase CaiB-like acyl-CoA transferase
VSGGSEERERTGRGRVVEVSMAETAYWTLMYSLAGFVREGVAPRMGNKQAANGLSPYDVYPASDGHVAVLDSLRRRGAFG